MNLSSSDKRPAISVLVNTYNQETTIARCLDSVLSQEFGEGFEIILTDDASSDGTERICREYAARYPHIIRYHRNERNSGIRDSYYDAILRCRGRYIADCAGDDFWVDPLKLRKEYDILESDPEIMLVHTAWRSIDRDTGKVSTPDAARLPEQLSRPVEDGRKLLVPILNREKPMIVHLCTALYRRDAIIEEYENDTPLFRDKEIPCEDLQLSCVLAARGKIAYIPDVTLHYQTCGMSDAAANSFQKNFDFYFRALKLNRRLQKKFGIADSEVRGYHDDIIPFIASQSFHSGECRGFGEFLKYVRSIPFRKTLRYRFYILSRYLPLIMAGILGFLFALLPVQAGDALRYAFIFPDDFYADYIGRIGSLADIWQSQTNHWHTVNGRVLTHFIIQIFCGLLPRWLFAILNGCAWMVLFRIVCRLGDICIFSFKWASVALLFFAIALFPLSTDIPVQVNYVWTAAVVFGWIMVFLSSRHSTSVTKNLLFMLWGFIAGACHEGFSIPVCIALAAYILAEEGRIGSFRRVGTAGFLAGAALLISATGNRLRISLDSGISFSMLNGIEQSLPALVLPALFIISYLLLKKREKGVRPGFTETFLLILAMASTLLSLALRFKYGVRSLFPATLVFTILCCRNQWRLSGAWPLKGIAVCWLAVVAMAAVKIYGIAESNSTYCEIERQYLQSTSKKVPGTAYLPDSEYIRTFYSEKDKALALEQTVRSERPSMPSLRVFPESFRRMQFERDSNYAVEILPQAWILAKSKANPADFAIEKTLLPGIINRKMSPRTVDFTNFSDIAVDTAGMHYISVYYNPRPYIRSRIKITLNNGDHENR